MIPIDDLCIHQLIELNGRIVERIKFLQRERLNELMGSFDYGDEVYFKDRDESLIYGKVIRFNQKSVTIKEKNGLEWRVSPSLVHRIPSGVFNVKNNSIGPE